MSGKKNTATRRKDEYEKDIDNEKIDSCMQDLLNTVGLFLAEFEEMDGDVLYSTYTKIRESTHSANHSKKVKEMPRVGPIWDFDKGVTGEYYYNV
jgi:hypothetical protein